MARINMDNFPETLKHKMLRWGEQQEPKWSLTRLVITLCQEWEDNLEDFEKRHHIRKPETQRAPSTKERKIEALKRQFEQQLAELEQEE